MRVVIWIVVVFAGLLIKTLIFGDEPMGAIPTWIIYGAILSAATALSSLWSKRKVKNDSNTPAPKVAFSNSSNEGSLSKSQTIEVQAGNLQNRTQNDLDLHKDDITDKVDQGNSLETVKKKHDGLSQSNEETELSAKDEELVSLPPIRFCRKCGFQLLPESDFCSHCGTKVIEARQA